MITKLLESQSFSKVWKTAVRQKLCAIVSKVWSRNVICKPLRGHILFAYPTNFSASSLGKNYNGYLELRLKTCNNMKSIIVWNPSFRLASRSFKNTGPNTATIFHRRIDRTASVLEVITSWKLQQVLRSYKHEAFQKVKYKLHLIEQPYLDKIHSRLTTTVNGL